MDYVMNCKICKAEVKKAFRAKVLHKHDVQYFTCTNCGFYQTEKPYWLPEAYSNAITSLDIGLLYRNELFKPIVASMIRSFFDSKARFIDYGGGYGVLVRMLRDIGFDFYRHDTYCDNIFAKNFDVNDLSINQRFEVLTAFEVFEHLENPMQEVEKMLVFSDNILFSTELVPTNQSINPNTWWYLAPETGQHIAFYTKASLQKMADYFSMNFYTNGSTLHLLTRKKISPLLFRLLCYHKISLLVKGITSGKSLLQTDFLNIKHKLNLENHL
ncbi:methyltransferase domain-containing protein [Pontibacter ruber]|uniref:Methyltransferase domain-containing protein n=1 Tax=Pontibacter ruber TaxID=1343895 RepID=A0ABW5CZ39_9BACT|nr:methyltransferase domain-containing protein [Pontibacter ruber]